MHIGLLVPDLTTRHGWGHYALSMIDALRAEGVRLTVLAARNQDLTYTTHLLDVDLRPILPTVAPTERWFEWHLLRSWPLVRRALAACDVIHAMSEWYAPLGVATAGKRPAFVTIHGSYAHLPKIRRFPLGQLHHNAFRRSELICVSRHTAEIVASIVPDARTFVVPNGVDAARYAQVPALPAEQHLDGPVILTAGGVKARKGTPELIASFARVHDEIPDAHCVVIGDTSREPGTVERVRQIVQEHGLQDRVHLLGRVEDAVLRAWYGAADVFAMPALQMGWKFEGFGLVYLEASAAGLPVVGTRRSGAEDAIQDGVTGYLVDPDELPMALSDALLRLLRDATLRAQMGQAGKRHAQAQTWQQAAKNVLELYADD